MARLRSGSQSSRPSARQIRNQELVLNLPFSELRLVASYLHHQPVGELHPWAKPYPFGNHTVDESRALGNVHLVPADSMLDSGASPDATTRTDDDDAAKVDSAFDASSRSGPHPGRFAIRYQLYIPIVFEESVASHRQAGAPVSSRGVDGNPVWLLRTRIRGFFCNESRQELFFRVRQARPKAAPVSSVKGSTHPRTIHSPSLSPVTMDLDVSIRRPNLRWNRG